jgi:transcriptional regulator with XRE-family HTH domain
MDQFDHPLRTWRKSQPLTQGQLAGLIGVVPSQVSQIENRLKGCSLDVALKIRDLAGDAVPLESLLPEAAE